MADDPLIPPGYTASAEPPWLTAMVDQRLALLVDKTGGNYPDIDLVQMPLTEPVEGQSFDDWDNQCDRCGTVTTSLHGGHVFRRAPDGTQILFSFGVCIPCRQTAT